MKNLRNMLARAQKHNAPAPIPFISSVKILEATCIGCGCRDSRACLNVCHWLIVDYDAGIGVCSNCEDKLEDFYAKGGRHEQGKQDQV